MARCQLQPTESADAVRLPAKSAASVVPGCSDQSRPFSWYGVEVSRVCCDLTGSNQRLTRSHGLAFCWLAGTARSVSWFLSQAVAILVLQLSSDAFVLWALCLDLTGSLPCLPSNWYGSAGRVPRLGLRRVHHDPSSRHGQGREEKSTVQSTLSLLLFSLSAFHAVSW